MRPRYPTGNYFTVSSQISMNTMHHRFSRLALLFATSLGFPLFATAQIEAFRGINLIADYSLDTSGYFTEDRRQLVEQVLSYFEYYLHCDVAHGLALTERMRSELKASLRMSVTNPSAIGEFVSHPIDSFPANEIHIYFGATEHLPGVLAYGNMGGRGRSAL